MVKRIYAPRFMTWLVSLSLCLTVNFVESRITASAQQKPSQTVSSPRSWAAQVIKENDVRNPLDKINARMGDKNSSEAGKVWKNAIGEVLNKKFDQPMDAMELFTFIGRYDPIWENDTYKPEESNRRVTRVKLLTREIINNWQHKLESIQKDGVSDLWTIGLLVNIDRLYMDNSFNSKESDILLGRLDVLPPSAIDSLADTLKTGRARSALAIVEADWMFDNNGFREQSFQQGLQAVKNSLTSKR